MDVRILLAVQARFLSIFLLILKLYLKASTLKCFTSSTDGTTINEHQSLSVCRDKGRDLSEGIQNTFKIIEQEKPMDEPDSLIQYPTWMYQFGRKRFPYNYKSKNGDTVVTVSRGR